MKCILCDKPRFKSREFCRDCIVRTVEKRAAKARHRAKLFRGARLALVNSGNAAGEVNLHLFRKLVTIEGNVRILKKPPKNPERYDFVFVPETADDMAGQLLKRMLGSHDEASPKNFARLLGDSTLKDAESYAGIKKIRHAPDGRTSEEFQMLRRMECRYNGTVHALAKAAEQLERSGKNLPSPPKKSRKP